ncbi:MAG: M1 family aminopeptidase [Bacteroidota bacterium]
MKIFVFAFLLTVHSFAVSAKKNETVSAAEKEYQRISSQLSALAVKTTPSAAIENVSIVRDAATFTLAHGTMYLLPTINQEQHALLFVGEGSVVITPPTDVEQKQLHRFFEEEVFPKEFTTLFLLFTDSTFREISAHCTFSDNTPSTNIFTSINHSLKLIRDKDNHEYDLDILRAFLFTDNPGMFYAHFYTSGNESFFFHFDPQEVEEVSFGRNLSDGPFFSTSGYRETILQFQQKKDSNRATPSVVEDIPGIDIIHYSMENVFAKDLMLASSCTMTFLNEVEGRTWIPFLLHHAMEVDSVFLPSGEKAEFVRLEGSDILWLYDNSGYSKGVSYTVTIHSHGEIVKNIEGWFSLETSFGWYPTSFRGRDKATFDLKFSVPEEYQFASVGTNTSTVLDNGRVRTEWKLAEPGRNASFMLGKFKEYTVTPDNIPPITVFVSTAHDVSLKSYLSQNGMLSGKNMEKQVSVDIENSIRFFQHVYGNTSVTQFYATEIPGGHGEAFPGLVHLSWATFQNTQNDGSDEIFRAHEVLHQWWGIGVDFQTYHDQWLSEAFATYSGLWYMQTVIKDNNKFFEQLRHYQKAILSNRKYLLGDGQESGPIWLGYRTSSSSTVGDYNLIIYKKGAWLLHMLRNMALDLKTMNEDVFLGMMREFYQTYHGKSASTADFQRITEKYFKMNMNWFFQQWLYNTEIPMYNITYKLQELENGKFKVKCTVRQTNVPNDFQMYVPFLVDFGEHRFARLRYLIKGPVTEFEFPILPLKPENIRFNDLESVLCEIDDESWD